MYINRLCAVLSWILSFLTWKIIFIRLAKMREKKKKKKRNKREAKLKLNCLIDRSNDKSVASFELSTCL